MSFEINVNNKLEKLLNEGRSEMFERKQIILFGIDAQTMNAKKNVRQYISQLVRAKSLPPNSNNH